MIAAGRRVRVMPQLKEVGIQAHRHYRYEVDEKLCG
jgi:hypothetical protein